MVVLHIYSQVRGDWIRNLNLAKVAYKNVTRRVKGQICHSAESVFCALFEKPEVFTEEDLVSQVGTKTEGMQKDMNF